MKTYHNKTEFFHDKINTMDVNTLRNIFHDLFAMSDEFHRERALKYLTRHAPETTIDYRHNFGK